MTKPNDYRETYMLATDVPYSNVAPSTKGTHAAQGILHRGRVVWLQNDPPMTGGEAPISAYAEGVGLVVLASNAVQPVR